MVYNVELRTHWRNRTFTGEPRTMNTTELSRIAVALERIADALESRRTQSRVTIQRTTASNRYLDLLRSRITFSGRATMDEILGSVGIQNPTKGDRISMSFALAEFGAKSERTNKHRYYILP
jgi:hypothetical protein